MVVGLVSAIGLVIISPSVISPEAGKALFVGNPIFPYTTPGIVSIPLGFIAGYLGTLFSSEKADVKKFEEVLVKSNAGIGLNK